MIQPGVLQAVGCRGLWDAGGMMKCHSPQGALADKHPISLTPGSSPVCAGRKSTGNTRGLDLTTVIATYEGLRAPFPPAQYHGSGSCGSFSLSSTCPSVCPDHLVSNFRLVTSPLLLLISCHSTPCSCNFPSPTGTWRPEASV